MAENENIKTASTSSPELIVLKFADSKVPLFKESRNKDYIKYGEDNTYPEYLTLLFNKSAKHNAIITGKANYIFGNGYENGEQSVNRTGDSLNDIAKKSILDIEIYGGFRWEVIWDRAGKVAEIYHVDYSCIRTGKAGGFFWKESWSITNRDEEIPIPGFNPATPNGSQIFAYNQYRPTVRYYPLPDYIGCNNYIETDIEISKYYLSAIRNGFMPSKLVEFISTELPDEKKRDIERRWASKFSGSENAGKFIFSTAASKEKSINIVDLSATDLDKQFIELNKTVQQEIFSGHKVVSPMLFGIKTEGQLGGNNEVKTAYETFVNTYAKPRANDFDRELNWVMSYSRLPGKYELKQTDPIGLQFDVKDVIDKIPTQFIFEKLGIPKELWGTPSATPGMPGAAPATASADLANENIKNLTAKQHQQVMRIIRQYSKGQLTEVAAKALLRTGLGLSEDDINSLLGIEKELALPAKMSFDIDEDADEIIGMFDACGDDKEDYEFVRSKRVSFASDDEAAEDEITYMQAAFKKFEISKSEQEILDAVKINPKVTVKEIAVRTKTTETYINTKIKGLINEGYLEGDIGSLLVPPKITNLVDKVSDYKPTQVFIKYSYEGPQDSRNRPFCAKMLLLNRLYSRYDIEKISERLGYSVFDRRGGFWRQKDGTILDHCRHNWKSNFVIKKGGAK